jgi:dephospho-CoA kinase
MGKSTAGKFIEDWGVPVIDTDLLARQIVEPGEPALAEIREAFGDRVVDPKGRLLRGVLAEIVFADETARGRLEAILHPRIRQIWMTQVEMWRAEGRRAAAVMIPLLFETGAQSQFDAVICVACSQETQQARLLERSWSRDEIQKRIRAQQPIEKKMMAADYVAWTDTSLDVHAAQLRRILAGLGIAGTA